MKHPLFITKDGKSYFSPFVLVTSLFFLWGFAHSILDVLNKHFQSHLDVSKAESGLVQTMVYGGYFLMALPAGWIIKKWGYRIGVVTGLLLYGVGALLFIPGEQIMSFPFFLFSLFVIGCGLTCLETSANPYITILGKPEDGARRLNLAQSFNGLGWIMGPMVGSLLILSDDSQLALPYAVVGIIVILLGLVFTRLDLPIPDAVISTPSNETLSHDRFFNKFFWFGAIALFLYVAAQTGINSFFINYVTEIEPTISAQLAGLILSFGGMSLLLIGRLVGSSLMKYTSPSSMLAICALASIICMIMVVCEFNIFSLIALCAVYLFESIMFPTIFAMALYQAETNKERASSILIMCIVGGAISPILMGYIGQTNMAIGFTIPLICFIGIFIYAITNMKLRYM